MAEPVWFRWLGVAGIELCVGGRYLLIDPFVTRPPLRRVLAGRVDSNVALVAEKIPHGDDVVVTHSHWDHILDVPTVARQTGAAVYGSPNACRLLKICGVPEQRVHPLVAFARFTLGPYEIEALPAEHVRILGWPVFAGTVGTGLRPPLRLRDYRMDDDFSMLVESSGYRLLDWSSERVEHAAPADVLFVKPHTSGHAFFAALLDAARPRLVIPIHWDDFLRPLSRPMRASFGPPRWSVPPLRRVDLAVFQRLIEDLAPATRVFVPEIFRRYELSALL